MLTRAAKVRTFAAGSSSTALRGDGAAFQQMVRSTGVTMRRPASVSRAPTLPPGATRPEPVLIGREEYQALSFCDRARFRGVRIEVMDGRTAAREAIRPAADVGGNGHDTVPAADKPDLYVLVAWSRSGHP